MANGEGEKSRFEITKPFNGHTYELRDVQTGEDYVFKGILNDGEAERISKAAAFTLPQGLDNVYIPKPVTFDVSDLPAEIRAMPGGAEKGLLMEKARGTSLQSFVFGAPRGQSITPLEIPREDWDKLEFAVSAWWESGVTHGDLRNVSNILVRQENGKVCFDIIDWGGPEYTPRETDMELLKDAEFTLVRAGVLAEFYPGQKADLQAQHEREIWQQSEGLVLDTGQEPSQQNRYPQFGFFWSGTTPKEILSGEMKDLPPDIAEQAEQKGAAVENETGKEGKNRT